ADPDRTGRHRPAVRALPARVRTEGSRVRTEESLMEQQQHEVWFLTGSQKLYGEETLRQVAEQSRPIAAALDASAEVPVRVVWQPVLTDAEEIRRVCLQANATPSCIGVIAWMHTFSPAKMWIGGLQALQLPLLHLHTQANQALPWAEIDM